MPGELCRIGAEADEHPTVVQSLGPEHRGESGEIYIDDHALDDAEMH